MKDELDPLREEIDSVDSRILELLNLRMGLSGKIGQVKARQGLPLFHPGREEVITTRLARENPGPLKEQSIRAIYREIFAASRLLQVVIRVAYLGPEWTYSHLAALSLFGHSAEYMAQPTLEDVFDTVQKGKSHVAVVPVENSLQGGVGRTLDLLFERDSRVGGECYLEVAHYLCGGAGSIGAVRRLYAQPIALDQCRRWYLENLRDADVTQCASTAQAAALAGSDPEGAAVCNLHAAHSYGLNILAERIEDQAGNTTRFLVLADHEFRPTGTDKTSLLFAVSDRPGALHQALESFAGAHVNMSRIESRPNRVSPWQYLFYADVEGHREDETVRTAIEELRVRSTFLKVLGSYPRRDPGRPIRPEKENLRG